MSDASALLPAGLFQVAIVVRDLDAAINMLTTALGAGEFRMVESSTRKVYRGEPVEPEHLIAIADFGPLSIEVIQPVRGESVYTEFLAKHGEGVHHLGFKLGSAEAYTLALDHLTAAGFPSAQSGRRADLSYDYMDTEPAIGTYVELVWREPEPGSAPV
jgi:catechol 2,3-dioxygenase-like lactoylglutathione lyase family enzyme